ncbi:Zinc finger BED domain-containing protein 1 [Thelohanellus kitauei]|uniref:Zinc finger BED domain-containing protein 1 n=1 Tax=Thelohanellus kitauei TaxID=669202 RepID=A0A0C2MTW5_THEKT|nr:Zinc finger BED domain-containing protein 1 [Thelohanellus kitauei]
MLHLETNVVFTADYQTSKANESYLGVTGHLISLTWELCSVALGVRVIKERRYSSAYAEHFKSVADDWEIFDKISTFKTDNARNVICAFGSLPFQHMPCIAHILQLSVNKGIKESGLEAVLSKSLKLVENVQHSPANQTELKENQSLLNVKEEVFIQNSPTRWNSTLQMIERPIRNKEAVIEILNSSIHKHSLTLLTDAEWERLCILRSFLEPCRYAT